MPDSIGSDTEAWSRHLAVCISETVAMRHPSPLDHIARTLVDPRFQEFLGLPTADYLQQHNLEERITSALGAAGFAADQPVPPNMAARLSDQLLRVELAGTSPRSANALEAQDDSLSQVIEKSRAEDENEATAQHGKFAGSTFTLAFTDLPAFHGGLEALIGSPSPNLLPEMEIEHCKSPDSKRTFVTSNYGIETSSTTEWWFVIDPVTGLTHLGLPSYPSETHDCTGKRMRSAVGAETLEHLRPRLAEINGRLQKMGEEILLEEELIGGRLYTGPTFRAQ